MVILTPDGYLMRVEAEDGELAGGDELVGFRFESNDCTGQAYIDSAAPWLQAKGGHVVRVYKNAAEPRFGRVEWFPVVKEITALSSGITGATCNPLNVQMTAIPATIIEPAEYKVKDLGGGVWGVKPPREMRHESVGADGIFCDGFECQQQ